MAEYDLSDKLVVGITPSAPFDVHDSHDAFRQSIEEYRRYQDEHIDEPLPPGVAFPFVQVIVLAKDDATTGLRIMKSIAHYGLDITRAVFTESKSPHEYIDALNICLFLSGNAADAASASAAGYPAGQVLGRRAIASDADDPDSLLVALDFDRVLADDEAAPTSPATRRREPRAVSHAPKSARPAGRRSGDAHRPGLRPATSIRP